MSDFKIRILEQYWIDEKAECKTDLCSHGLLYLEIGDQIIANETDGDWTISTAGLMLLRTINTEHTVDENYPIVQHCGQLGMLGCPISIDWTVIHKGESVIIQDVKKYPSTDKKDVIEYEVSKIDIERKKYIREVVRFCDSIKLFFVNQEKEFISQYEKEEWIGFWSEFDKILEKSRKELKITK